MVAKFLGCEQDKGHKADTGEVWESHELQVLVAGQGSRTIRVSPDVYRATRSLDELADVRLEFGLAKGRFGRFYPVVERVVPIGAKAA